MVTKRTAPAAETPVVKKPRVSKAHKPVETEGASANGAAPPNDDVMMYHTDGRSTEVHRNSVEIMEGHGWSTKPHK